jgi:serine/threonine protein kinase
MYEYHMSPSKDARLLGLTVVRTKEMETDDDQLRQTAGTAIFSAPEMLTGDSFLGKPIDVWACGVTLYMFVYGHPPFVAPTMPELYHTIAHDPIAYPPVVGDHVVAPELLDLLQKVRFLDD